MPTLVAEAPPRAAEHAATSLIRPLQLGLSIGHPIGPSGCLGPFVRLSDGRPGFLSALHVLAPVKAKAGDFIHQPSPVDGLATGETRIAQLVAQPAPTKSGATLGIAAAALLEDMSWLGNIVPGPDGQAIAAPLTPHRPVVGEPIVVIGREGLTHGWVSAVDLSPLSVMTPQGAVTFVDCLELKGAGSLTTPGDAGALVCRQSDFSALALVFAVGRLSDQTEATYALPLGPAMTALSADWL